MSSQKHPPAQPPPSSLPRSRSLRKPQVGVSVSVAAAAAASTAPASAPASRLLRRPSKTTTSTTTSTSRGIPRGSTSSTDKPPTRTASIGRPRRTSVDEKKAPSTSLTSTSTSTSRHYPPSASASAALRRPAPASLASGGPPSPGRSSSALNDSAASAASSSASSSSSLHGRTKSTTALRTSNPPSATAGAPVLRPPSAQSPTSSASTYSTSGKSARTLSHQRSISFSPTTTNSTSTTTARPAFSIMQQNFSPAKNTAPKPRTAALLAPPSPSKRPANVALSAETARLQAALLQLHLLHRDAAAATAAWHASARDALARRFAEVATDDAVLLAESARRAETVNARALQRWLAAHDGEALLVLDAVLAGVWALAAGAGDSSNRHGRVVRRFELWAEQTAALVAQRDAAEDEMSGDPLLLLPEDAPALDAAWHADCASLTRKLRGWQQQLDGLQSEDDEDDDGDSSLARILGGCRSLVDDLLAELGLMQQLERDAAAHEQAWVRRMNEACARDKAAPARTGAVWRVV